MKFFLLTVVILGSLLADAPSALAQGVTFATNALTVGYRPYFVTVADVNNDGKLDLISANNSAGTLTVLTNNGAGGFVLNATLNLGYGPSCVVAADINGDNKPDLISANYDDSTLTVMTNNGNGGFGFEATLKVGYEPNCVAAADVNGDNKLDLISANYHDSTLTVLTNNGTGGFGLKATLSTVNPGSGLGYGPNYVAAADINGDGKVDLISANFDDNTLTVLTNDGRGGFVFKATLYVGSEPSCVVAADINGDGKVDLITANFGDDTLTVLTNNGSGGFGFYATLPVGSAPNSVTVADVNGDGKVDLISANEFDNTLTVLTNNRAGGFGFNATLPVGSEPACVAAGDFNGDGKVDLVSANSNDNTLTLLLNATAPSAPRLNIARAGNQIVLSWPVNATNYILQVTPKLVPAAWINSTSSPVVVGSQFVVTNTITGGSAFYRLILPGISAPVLNLARVANQVVLSWPASATNFILQVTTSLSAPSWTTATGSPVVTGSQFVVTNAITSGNAFYRLKK